MGIHNDGDTMTLKNVTDHAGTASATGGATILLLADDPLLVALGVVLILGAGALGAFRYWAKLKYTQGGAVGDGDQA